MHKFIGHCVIYTVTSCHLHHCCQTLGFKKIFSMSVVVDYAGPLAVKHYAHSSYPKALTLGKPNAHISYGGKVWVCLFTWVFCAIHFEIATDITPLSFIRCFKRFVSRTGLPTQIISDNGTTFRIACKTIRNILSNPKFKTTSVALMWNGLSTLSGPLGGEAFLNAWCSYWDDAFERWWDRQNQCID